MLLFCASIAIGLAGMPSWPCSTLANSPSGRRMRAQMGLALHLKSAAFYLLTQTCRHVVFKGSPTTLLHEPPPSADPWPGTPSDGCCCNGLQTARAKWWRSGW